MEHMIRRTELKFTLNLQKSFYETNHIVEIKMKLINHITKNSYNVYIHSLVKQNTVFTDHPSPNILRA